MLPSPSEGTGKRHGKGLREGRQVIADIQEARKIPVIPSRHERKGRQRPAWWSSESLWRGLCPHRGPPGPGTGVRAQAALVPLLPRVSSQ